MMRRYVNRDLLLVSCTQNPYQPMEEMLSVQVGHYGLVREFDWSKSKYHWMLFSLTNTYQLSAMFRWVGAFD